jgi:hypothetical protein
VFQSTGASKGCSDLPKEAAEKLEKPLAQRAGPTTGTAARNSLDERHYRH